MLDYRVFFDQRIDTLTYSFEMMKQSHLSYEQSNGIGIFNLKNVVFMIAGFIFSLVTFQVGKNFKLVVYRKRELDICTYKASLVLTSWEVYCAQFLESFSYIPDKRFSAAHLSVLNLRGYALFTLLSLVFWVNNYMMFSSWCIYCLNQSSLEEKFAWQWVT